jgi:hypothetical protein
MWSYRTSFEWTDNETVPPSDLEIEEMGILADGLIEGCREICADPLAFLAGPEAEVKQTQLLRVLFWLLLRTHKGLTDDQVRTVLGMFDVYQTIDLVNNANMVELIRLLQGLPDSAAPIVAERFMAISTAVFTARFSNAANLEAGYFVVFFDTFGRFLVSRPELAQEFCQVGFFGGVIERIASNPTASGLKHFLEFTALLDWDVWVLLRPHLTALATHHCETLTDLFSTFLENGADDERYTEAVTYILLRIGASVNQPVTLAALGNRIVSLSPLRKLLNGPGLSNTIDQALNVLSAAPPAKVPLLFSATSFIVAISTQSAEFRALVRANLSARPDSAFRADLSRLLEAGSPN